MIQRLLNTQGCLSRADFFFRVTIILTCAVGLSFLIMETVGKIEHYYEVGIFMVIIVAAFAAPTIYIQAMRRLHDMGRRGIGAMLLFLPVYNIYLLMLLLFAPGRTKQV